MIILENVLRLWDTAKMRIRMCATADAMMILTSHLC